MTNKIENNKFLEIKRNHHFVWSYYLLNWRISDKSKDVFYITKNGGLACDSVKGLAYEEYFYKIKPFSKDALKLIKQIISNYSAESQNVYNQYLDNFLFIQYIKENFIKNLDDGNKLNKIYQAIECNILENLHAGIENEARSILDSLSNGKLDIFEETHNQTIFCIYLGQQWLRTESGKNKIQRVNLSELKKDESEQNTFIYKFYEEAWWFIALIIGIEVGKYLFASRGSTNHVLLVNKTSAPFVTSIQPVINIHSCLDIDSGNPPLNLDLYYPLSPKYAYLINQSDEFGTGIIGQTKIDICDEAVVDKLNIKMAHVSNYRIFANEKNVLKKLNKFRIKK